MDPSNVFSESALTLNCDLIMGGRLGWCYLLGKVSLMQKVCNVCPCADMRVLDCLKKLCTLDLSGSSSSSSSVQVMRDADRLGFSD